MSGCQMIDYNLINFLNEIWSHLSHWVIANCFSPIMYCRTILDIAGLTFIISAIEKSSRAKLHIYHF